MKHHLIIGGTGRAGTSLLVKYLTECGLETHISRNEKAYWDENAMAGLEDLPLAGSDSPYVVKTPWLFECVDDLVKRKDIAIDAVIIPVRDLVEAAASRSILELRARHADAEYMDQNKTWEHWGITPGGTVYSVNPIDQSRILAVGFHKAVHVLVKHEIKIIFLDFPRLAEDAEYLYEQLRDILPKDLEKDSALQAHAKIADPSKVRTGPEISETRDKTTRDHKLADPGIQYPGFDAVDNIALKRAISALRKHSQECLSQRDLLLDEKNSLIAERDGLLREREGLTTQRDGLIGERAALMAERAALRDAVTGDLDGLPTENRSLRSHKNRVLRKKRAHANGIAVIESLVNLLSNLLSYLRIDRIFLLGKGRRGKANRQSYKGK